MASNDPNPDLSDILQIPHCSSQVVNPTDSAQSLLDSNTNRSRNPADSASTSHFERTVKSLDSYEDSTSEYIKQNVIFDCLEQCAENKKNILSDDVANKLKGLLQTYDMKKFMNLAPTQKNSQEELTVLGIMNLPKHELNYEEKLIIKSSTEALLRERIQEIFSKFGEPESSVKDSEGSARSQLFQSRNPGMLKPKMKLQDKILEYENSILRCIYLINKWKEMKYKNQVQLNLAESEYLLLQSQVSEVQAKITKMSCVARMFKETPTTAEAFKILGNSMDAKLNALTEELRQKKELKKLYDELENTEYDEVLRSYIQICNAIKKKAEILRML